MPSLILFLPLLLLFQAVYAPSIPPYKSQGLLLSRPYALTPNIDYTLTFSIPEASIPSSAFLLLRFPAFATIFLASDSKEIFNCSLHEYTEASGLFFDESSDFTTGSSESSYSLISSCGRVSFSAYYFNLNKTLSPSTVYQLKFRVKGQFSEACLSFISLSFTSSLINPPYIYAVNDYFSLFKIKASPPQFTAISFKLKRVLLTKTLYNSMNQALENSLLTYENAQLEPSNFSVQSFNEMIKNGLSLNSFEYDDKIYPENIMFFPGFSGILVLEFLLDYDIDSFQLFELILTKGWVFDQSQCISVDFSYEFPANFSFEFPAISHTKCQIIDESTLTFYNIYSLKKNQHIRLNITSVRNPLEISWTQASFSIIDQKKRTLIQRTQTLTGLQTFMTSETLQINVDTLSRSFTDKNSLFLGKTQKIKIGIKQLFYDILEESRLELTVISTFSPGFGLKSGSCVLVNSDLALIAVKDKAIECAIDTATQTIIVKNIAKIQANNEFSLNFFNKNEVSGSFLIFSLKIFAKNSLIPSLSKTVDIPLIPDSLVINSANFVLFSDNSAISFDSPRNEIAEPSLLKIAFTLPTTPALSSKDSIVILLNDFIRISDTLLCKIQEFTEVFYCFAEPSGNMTSITIFMTSNTANLFTGLQYILSINWVKYVFSAENSYRFSYEFYFIYNFFTNPQYLIALKAADISATLTENPANSQLLFIVKGCNPSNEVSLIRAKVSSNELYQMLDFYQISQLKLRIFFQNLVFTIEDSAKILCFPADSSGASCVFRTGVNALSSDYRDWNYIEVSGISINTPEDFIDIPVVPDLLSPILYFSYYIVDNQKIEINYRNYKVFYTCPDENTLASTSCEISFDWEGSKEMNNGGLIARTVNTLVVKIQISGTVLTGFRGGGNSGFLLVFLPWIVTYSVEDSGIYCEFQTFTSISVNVRVFTQEDASGIVLTFMDFEESGTEFSDQMVCYNLWTPISRKQEKYMTFVTDHAGVLIAKKEIEEQTGVFDAGLFSF